MNERTREARKTLVVLPREDGKWVLAHDGTPSRATVHDSFSEALEEGRIVARRENLRLRVLHDPRRAPPAPEGTP